MPAHLFTVTQPLVQRVEIQLPPGLSPEESRRIREGVAVAGLRPGDPFSPVALDACLAEFPLYASLPHTSYLKFSGTAFDPATGIRLKMSPERGTSVALSLAPAYENSWGAHLGLGAEVRNPWGVPVVVAADGAFNSLQKRGSLRVNRELTWLPGFGYTVYSEYSRQRFGGDLLLLEGVQSGLDDLVIRHQSQGFGLWARFGGDDHGMLSLATEERRSSFTTAATDSLRGLERTVQATLEWDDLDFHTLPMEGFLFRLRGGRSFHVEKDLAPFTFGYGRIREIVHMPAMPFSLDFDLETALGWNTSRPRWYTLGGADSFIGTRGAAYLLPNSAIARFGVPFTSVSVFGVGIQVVPRLDWGRFALTPEDLGHSARIFGKGLVLRSIIQAFHVEMSFGQTESRGFTQGGTRRGSEFTLLIGARPFDLWRQR